MVRTISIRIMRQLKNLTQYELAKKIGVNQASIAQWENGATNPRYSNLIKIAEVLDCSIDDLVKPE